MEASLVMNSKTVLVMWMLNKLPRNDTIFLLNKHKCLNALRRVINKLHS
jgi:hypothetical protein